MITVWDILSTVGGVRYGDIPMVLHTPTVLMISSPHMHHDILTVLSIPHGTHTEHSPTVLKISPHGTHHISRYSNKKDGIPHGTEHPHGTHDISPHAS